MPAPIVLLMSGVISRAMEALPGGPPYLSNLILPRLKWMCFGIRSPFDEPRSAYLSAILVARGGRCWHWRGAAQTSELRLQDADDDQSAAGDLQGSWLGTEQGRDGDGDDRRQVQEQHGDHDAGAVHAVVPGDDADADKHQHDPCQHGDIERGRR